MSIKCWWNLPPCSHFTYMNIRLKDFSVASLLTVHWKRACLPTKLKWEGKLWLTPFRRNHQSSESQTTWNSRLPRTRRRSRTRPRLTQRRTTSPRHSRRRRYEEEFRAKITNIWFRPSQRILLFFSKSLWRCAKTCSTLATDDDQNLFDKSRLKSIVIAQTSMQAWRQGKTVKDA